MHSPYKGHLAAAHTFWSSLIHSGDVVVDATCGNGYDTLILAKLALTKDTGWLYGFDIQEKAIQETKKRLQNELSDEILPRITLTNSSHESFSEDISPHSVKLIVYNLGYLPGGNKEFTTQSESTIISLEKGLGFLKSGGAISVTCYPGHNEGEREETAVLAFAASLSPQKYACTHQRWINRERSPSLLIIRSNL